MSYLTELRDIKEQESKVLGVRPVGMCWSQAVVAEAVTVAVIVKASFRHPQRVGFMFSAFRDSVGLQQLYGNCICILMGWPGLRKRGAVLSKPEGRRHP